MRCPACGHANPEGSRFCLDCGAKLARVCTECGTELPPGAKFCFECGARTGAALETTETLTAEDTKAERLQRLVPKAFAERLLSTQGEVQRERRMVTILFSDVKGSTAMGEALDPEDVMEIMDGAFDVLIEPIYRYEGTLARLMGDAILAFFGAPIAHEDDPERACRAALDIVEGGQAYAEQLARERGIEGFNVRVGINTGLVVVGEVGSDLRVEYTAMGDAINLAARMEGAAEPGTVLIAENTHRLIAPLFETEPLGPIAVKGRTEPVSVYRVVRARAARGKVRGIAGLESALVGREAEYAALRDALERLRAGVGGIVTVVGEAGLGKSRLVAELRKAGATHGRAGSPRRLGDASHLNWVEGRCLSYGGSIAYLLWLDVLRGLVGVTLEHTPGVVEYALRQMVQSLCPERFDDVYPYLGRLMSLPLEDGLASRLDDMDGQDLKTRTFEGVEMLLRCAASQAPLVLVCEDLHWADPTSIELLTRVLSVAGEVPLLLLCILRPVKDHSCWRFRDLAAQQYPGQYTDVLLDPLSPDESQTLVANLLEVDDLPAVLRRRVLSRAEGNPFYVEEVIRSLIDRHAITLDARTGRWTARSDVGEIPIPDTLQGVLMARIDRLQEDTKRVLQLAAVIGRTFLHRVLAEIAVEERRLDRQLLTLQQEEMIRQRARIPELEYIFKHDLTREAAYNGLLKRQRRAFHRQVAETLEQLFAERVEEQAGLLAHHWERAGDAEKAIPYLQRAGDAARLMYSHEEAISYYRRALVLLMQQEEHEQAARTWMKLGLTYHTAFRFRESRQAYEEGSAVRLEASRTGVPAALPAAPHALRQTLPEPTTLDPSKCSDAFAGCAIDHLFDGLLRLTPDMDVTPDLARAWEVSEDGRKYVFELRDDASWSDGTPVTAQDFEYAWKRILDPASASDNASFLYDLKGARQFHQGEISDPNAIGVRASDEWTLVLELEEPAGYFLQLMSHSAAYPLPRHAVRAHGEAWADADNLVTNGPFRLQAWHPGESMVLERSPGYRGRFAGNLHRVELVFVDPTNKQRLLESYEADQLDVLDTTYFPPALVEHARQRRANECVVGPDLSTIYLGFNVRQPPLADLRVRRAFVLASDRETLADVAHLGQRFPALGGFVPPGMPGHSPGIGLPYQPEEARQLLAEAGHPGGGGFPALDCVALGVSTTAVEWLREHWREILGIETTWRILDWVTFVERMSNEEPPNLWIWAWGADYPDPDNFLRVGFPWDLTGWRNSNYDRLVEKARRAMDQEERIQLYREADRIVVQEAPIMPAFHMRRQILVKPWVRKYPASAVTMSVWQDVVIEPH